MELEEARQKMLQVLRAARGIVRRGWAQGCAARNRRGETRLAFSSDACCWCLTAALAKAAKEGPDKDHMRFATDRQAEGIDDMPPTVFQIIIWNFSGVHGALEVWNDQVGRHKHEVVRMLTRMIRHVANAERLDTE